MITPPGASIVNASGPSLTSTFLSAASQDEFYTVDSRSQESRTSLNDDSNNPAHIQGSGNSTDELELDYKLPTKRARTRSKRSQESRRSKRHNFSKSNDT